MDNTFIVETSARHIHLTHEAVETLYGKCLRSEKC